VKKVVTALDLLAAVAEMSGAVGGKVENIYRTGAGYIFKLSSGYIAATKFRVSLTGVVPEKTHEGAETLRVFSATSGLRLFPCPGSTA